MIHYHGLPITPDVAAIEAVAGGHAFVSHAHPGQLGVAVEVSQSFAADNGAFSAWRAGRPVVDWSPYYDWVGGLLPMPSFDWAVIPDVIDGDETANDALVAAWPLPRWAGVPVWHMHEGLDRLRRLVSSWDRVALGSSGEFAVVGNARWWSRMAEAMTVACRDGRPLAKLHGLRMLDPAVFSRLPLASADSTNIARNIGMDGAWSGAYQPPTKAARARVLRSRIESVHGASEWRPGEFSIQETLCF